MKIKKIFSTKFNGEQLYLLAFAYCLVFLFIFTTTFTDYFPTRILQLLSYISLGMVIVKIYLFDDYNAKQLFGITVVLLLTALSWRHSQSNTQSNMILYMMVFIFGAKDVHFDKVIEWFYKIELIMILIVIIYSLLGIITNLAYFTPGRPTRYALGMVYPTDMASHILFIILAKCYLSFPKLRWYHYGIFLFLAVLVKIVADARLSSYTIIILVIVMIIAQLAQKGNKLCEYVASLFWMVIPILTYIAIVTVSNFDMGNGIMRKVNNLLSGRLLLSSQALNKYGVSLFGNPVMEHGSGGIKGMHKFFNTANYFYIDSSYIRLLIIYGVIMLILVVGIMMVITIRSTFHHSYIIPAIMVIVAISCLVEQHLLDLSFNPFLLSLLAINNYNKIDRIEKNE